MPIKRTTTTNGAMRASPFIAPVNETAAIDVLLTALTDKEIDTNGYLKAGVPLSRAGGLIGAQTASVPGSPVHTGSANGTIGAATGGFGQPAETITVTFTTSGATAAFRVVGSVSGLIGTGAVGTQFNSPQISFLLSDGSADWTAATDILVYTVTGGVSDRLYGVVVEDTKVLADNVSGTIAAATTAVAIVVALEGALNQDIIEDNLERSLTASEIAAFGDSRFSLV